MQIVWGEPKRQRNLAKHGLDFADLTPDFVEIVKEDRFLAIGELDGVTILAIVSLPLGSEVVSVTSMRPASRIERSRA